jgi:TetR/AcrR family transcriptional regulator, transcriptional repressor for nem operon
VLKTQQTKQQIIEQAAILFNQNGYVGTSIADIMRSTGIGKGSIYSHFRNKDEIAIAAFDHTLNSIIQAVMLNVEQEDTAIDRLTAFVDTFRGFTTQPIGVGGCPILNTAVESDDTHPEMRLHVQQAVNQILALVGSIIALGMRQGEILANTNIEEVSTVILATIEGSIMMSKLYGNDLYLDRSIAHLHQYISELQVR